jgi:hypothetical protein
MGAAYNPTIKQYSSWEITLSIKTPQNTPFILTDYTGESQIRASYSTETILASPTVTITDANNGIIKIHLSDTQTAALVPTDPKLPLPVWDVLLSNTARTNTFIVAEGRVTVLPGVTRWSP